MINFIFFLFVLYLLFFLNDYYFVYIDVSLIFILFKPLNALVHYTFMYNMVIFCKIRLKVKGYSISMP